MKHIIQHDTMQCGVACIEMICKYDALYINDPW